MKVKFLAIMLLAVSFILAPVGSKEAESGNVIHMGNVIQTGDLNDLEVFEAVVRDINRKDTKDNLIKRQLRDMGVDLRIPGYRLLVASWQKCGKDWKKAWYSDGVTEKRWIGFSKLAGVRRAIYHVGDTLLTAFYFLPPSCKAYYSHYHQYFKFPQNNGTKRLWASSFLPDTVNQKIFINPSGNDRGVILAFGRR